MPHIDHDHAGGLTDQWDDSGSILPSPSAAYDVDTADVGLGGLWVAGVAFLAAVVLQSAVVVAAMVALGWVIAGH